VSQLLHSHGLKALPIATDANGFDTAALERALQQRAAEGSAAPVFAYLIPTFHNPSGACTTLSRRSHLLSLAAKYRFGVVTDELFHSLHFDARSDAPPFPTLSAVASTLFPSASASASASAPPFVASIHSFAKILSDVPCGWVHSHTPGFLRRLHHTQHLQRHPPAPNRSHGAWNPALHSAELRATLCTGAMNAQSQRVRQSLARRCALLCDALRAADRHQRAVHFTEPKGGYFVWLQLPEGVDSRALALEAAAPLQPPTTTATATAELPAQGVLIAPGSASWCGGSAWPQHTPNRYVRLCFGALTDERLLIEGARRVVGAVHHALRRRQTHS
jgi:DNA-binding transcriptional MocR family regulator